jgi:hypothetical protein
MEELFLDCYCEDGGSTLLCYCEDGGSTLLQNDVNYLPVDTVLHRS